MKLLFQEIGLAVNPSKSIAINIENGKLMSKNLSFPNGDTIKSINNQERIRYLGCTFEKSIVFNTNIIEKFSSNIEKMIVTPLLKPNQKLNIFNQYIFPTLIYPIQSAPLKKIPKYITERLDTMIRRATKSIIGLPTSTNTEMFYAARNVRGLGLIRCEWEIFLQRFSIANKLNKINDELLARTFDCHQEMQDCVKALNVTESNSSVKMRAELRRRSYDLWCKQAWQGFGVHNFDTYHPTNHFMTSKSRLTSSEFTAAIKLNTNYANVRGLPWSTTDNNLCRKCGKEKETPAHVIGSCSSNNSQIIARHHRVKKSITKILQQKGFDCFEEVYAIDQKGSNRFSDIVAFDRRNDQAIIVDPTVRFETNDLQQDEKIKKEKSSIYESCLPYYSEKYLTQYGVRNWSVFGLWFGARGSVGNSVLDFFDKFKLDRKLISEISENVLIDSLRILHFHIYS